jgi:endonuclease III
MVTVVAPETVTVARGDRKPLAALVKTIGGRFSTVLGIDLASGESTEIFKWLLAAILFGARISGRIAVQTYNEFVRENLLTPNQLLRRGWDGLVEVLDRGGYVRYDFKTATKLLEVCQTLMDRYDGDLHTLHSRAEGPADLEQKIHELGKGIGDITAGIFLREMRGIWRKAEPMPSDLVLSGAQSLGLLGRNPQDKKRALEQLKIKWAEEGGRPAQFPDFEAALLRRGLAVRRNSRKRGKGET